MATLMIDNYDSFTYNIYQYLEQLGAHVVVHRNDKITIEECIKLNPRNIVISPGPGHPLTSSGISKQVIEEFAGKVPILGICLGEQCMYTTYGGTVAYTGEIVHGKTSSITHDGKGLFKDVPQGIQVTRYHSLSGDPDTLPDCLEITSWTNSRKVMGVRHKEYVMEGVQFHPESIITEAGYRILANFLKWEGGRWSELRIRQDIVNPVFDKLGYGSQNGISDANNKSDGETRKTKILLPSTDSYTTSSLTSERNQNNNTAFSKITKNEPISEHITETIEPASYPMIYSLSSIELIVEQRRADLAKTKCSPGRQPYHLNKTIHEGFIPETIDIIDVLKNHPYNIHPEQIKDKKTIQQLKAKKMEVDEEEEEKEKKDFMNIAIIAEAKRASPSKGNIDINMHAISQALEYVSAGITCISVMTEPRWFKGSINDLRDIRMAVSSLPQRPAIIQNDFIIDPYQIMEARINGADAITLYASILTKEHLKSLLDFTHSLKMKALVVVLDEIELKNTLSLNVKLIGVSNRNLHTFDMDSNNSTNLAKLIPNDVVLVSMSGIKTYDDVLTYYRNGAKAILVGESLIKAKDKKNFVKELITLKQLKKRKV